MKKPAKNIVPFLFLLLSFNWACSQAKPVIRKSYGYYSERLPGNIPADSNGNPLPGFGPDTTYTIYMETATADLGWDTAWVGEKTFSILAQRLPGRVIEAGMEKNRSQPAIIRAGKGTVLWRLDLIPQEPAPEKPGIPGRQIIIKVRKDKKQFEIHIDSLVELQVPPSV
ncbi:MAG: hypothetical protein HZA79_05735 [Sphingobacteriales bacterium]|nr:hypothetical protein [Sphingobacteriales bacterium]